MHVSMSVLAGVTVPYLCRNLLRKLPCLKASARASRYAWLPFSPVTNQGMFCGAGIACAATLFSRDPLKLLAVLRPFRTGVAGAGEGDMRTTSARLFGPGVSLL